MRLTPLPGSGTVLVERYRLEERLSGPDPVQGSLWRATDVIGGDCPVALRHLTDPIALEQFRQRWEVLQQIASRQLPRCGQLLDLEDGLWAVRDWQEGSSLALLQEQRAQRQLGFSPGEVLLLLKQALPVVEALHAHDLVHGQISLQSLWRRSSDGLPVLLKAELAPANNAAGWMDVRDLAVSAVALLTGQPCNPLALPEGLGLDPAFQAVLERLLAEDSNRRFADAASAQKALQQLAMPEQSGPVQSKAAAPGWIPAPDSPEPSLRDKRAMARERGAEGRLWPVVIALGLSALVGSAIGWVLLARQASRGRGPATGRDRIERQQTLRLPQEQEAGEERQHVFSRLQALQVDRAWFVNLADSSLLRRFPERGGRLPSPDALEDAPLRQVWMDLAEEWLARIEQLPPAMRARLGNLREQDWEQPRQSLVDQGVHPQVVEQLVSAGARDLLPGDALGRKPLEPYRQLWFAAAIQSLEDVEIAQVQARPLEPTTRSLRIPAGGARLILISVPAGDQLVAGINGTPLMQMTVFAADGRTVEERGPLRVVRISPTAGSPLQVLITNDGVSSALLTLSCRADPPTSPLDQ